MKISTRSNSTYQLNKTAYLTFNTRKIFLISTLLCIFLQTGCMSIASREDSVPASSLALKVVNAAGMYSGIQDVSRVELKRALAEQLKAGGIEEGNYRDAVDAGFAVAHAQKLIDPPSGFSNWNAAGMSILGMLARPSLTKSQVVKLIVWMPDEMAEDEEDAQLKMGRILENAAIKALPEGYSSKVLEWTDVAVLGATSPHRVIKVDGPLCPQWSCMIQGPFPVEGNLSRADKMSATTTPGFLEPSSSGSYTYSSNPFVLIRKITKEYDEQGKLNGHWHRIKAKRLEQFDHTQWYVEISKHLPEWAYYYLPLAQEGSSYVFFSVPVVMNRGKPLYFVTP